MDRFFALLGTLIVTLQVGMIFLLWQIWQRPDPVAPESDLVRLIFLILGGLI